MRSLVLKRKMRRHISKSETSTVSKLPRYSNRLLYGFVKTRSVSSRGRFRSLSRINGGRRRIASAKRFSYSRTKHLFSYYW